MYSPAGVSFFSSGLPKSPPNVEPVVAVKIPVALSFFSLSFGGPNRFVVVAGVASFFSSGFIASLFAVVVPNNPPPEVPPVPEGGKEPTAERTGVDVPNVSGFLAPKKPPPSAGVVAEVEAEAVVESTGLGGSPKNPVVAGVVVLVVVDESPAGFGGPPNSPPVVVLVLGGPPKRPLEVAAKVFNIEHPKVKIRIHLVLEHPYSPWVLVYQTTLRQRQGQEQGS